MPVIENETPPFRTRKVTKAGVLLFAGATFGVAYEFDDGQRITELSGSKNKLHLMPGTGSAMKLL
jgi:hypothetical protein